MRHFFSVLLFIACFIPVTNAQTLNVKKLDSLFNILQNHGLANGSIAILVNGKIEYQKAIGFSRLDTNKSIAANSNTVYRIGSVSKMFTAVIIFQLAEEQRLSLGQKLSAYFPQLPNAGKVTIRQLLQHRSGLHDYTRDTKFTDWMDQPKTHEALLKIIEDKGADFEPGTKVEYSNTNYLVLSYIIEKVTGMTYAEALDKKIIAKSRLLKTHYGKQVGAGDQTASYKYGDSAWRKEKETDLSIHCGAGSIVSTPTDLVKFIQYLFTGKLISPASVDSMKTMTDGYGMGMFPFDFETEKGYGHNGRIEEFYSAARYYPKSKMAVCYITNGILYPRTDILDGVLKICFNKDYTIPLSKTITLESKDLDKYTGRYFSPNLPFKVVCKKEGTRLILEVAGKSMEAAPVTAHYFMNLKTGSFFEFNPDKGRLQIKETDNMYYLQKEN